MIDDIVYTYEKALGYFGKPLQGIRDETRFIGSIPHDEGRKSLYANKNPKNIILGNIPEFTEHAVSFI